MFTHSCVAIQGGVFTLQEGANKHAYSYIAFERLEKAVASSAFHDSNARFDPPKCHPNTRVAVLDCMTHWIFAESDRESSILWLYGPAGAGKSAIAQTIADNLSNNKTRKPIASFFFSRSDPTRDRSQPLIATLAYQLTVAIPEIRAHVEAAITKDPLIFDRSLDAQMRTLIVQPLQELVSSEVVANYSLPALIIIDGLDECKNPQQQETILLTIGKALREHHVPLIFLIASRPEQQITFAFNSPALVQLWTSVVLDNKFKPDKDIRVFLHDSFKKIKTTHPRGSSLPSDWPEPTIIDALVKKSSGQFIYAAVVQKFISALNARPSDRLEVVMKLRPASRDAVPLSELDELYRHLLLSSSYSEHLMPILAIIILRRGRDLLKNPYDVEHFLGLEDGDVEIAMSPLLSVVTIWPEISLTHASVADFLLDETRSGNLHINPTLYNRRFAVICINHIMNATRSPVEYPQSLNYLRKQYYSFKHLTKHISDTIINDDLVKALKELSLPSVWRHYIPNSKEFSTIRKDIIPSFINFFKDKASEDENCRKLYMHHASSMDVVMEVEIRNYYSDPSLFMLLVISCMSKLPDFGWYFLRNADAKILFGMNKKSEQLDNNAFRLFRTHSRWNGLLSSFIFNPERSHELFISGDIYAQTALRVLEYLCKPRKHPHSLFRGPVDSFRHTGHINSLNRARQRRIEKHQRGRLSLMKDSKDFKPSKAGLKILPELLKRSTWSNELITFILFHQLEIVVMRKRTRWTINSILDYLDRVNQNSE